MRLALAAVAFIVAAGPVLADQRCMVTDPTGTPLNVRATPNGTILGALYNGQLVERTETLTDGQGRDWILIFPLDNGKAGWVIRRYVSCR